MGRAVLARSPLAALGFGLPRGRRLLRIGLNAGASGRVVSAEHVVVVVVVVGRVGRGSSRGEVFAVLERDVVELV